jgi:hypothetical protein
VIGNNIEHLAEAARAQPELKTVVGLGAAELVVHFVVIDDIVAMPASGRGLQIGRAVNVRNAEIMKVIGDSGGLFEAEICVQL